VEIEVGYTGKELKPNLGIALTSLALTSEGRNPPFLALFGNNLYKNAKLSQDKIMSTFIQCDKSFPKVWLNLANRVKSRVLMGPDAGY